MTQDTSQSTPALRMENVSVELGGVEVLKDVSFSINPGNLVGIVGPNGGGKTTLFNVVAGICPIKHGVIRINGQPINSASQNLAYVPQRESVNWRFPVTAEDVVMHGRTRLIGWLRRPTRCDKSVVEHCLRQVDMWHRRSALVTELSGGQRQRVFVARALAQEASLFLLDEAFSGVDVGSQEELVAILRRLRDQDKTILMATHDLTGLAQRFDEVVCLNRHVCAYGPPDVAFTPDVLAELYGAHGVQFSQTNGSEVNQNV